MQRQDRTGTQIDEANAPADISIQVYSQGNIVSQESGPLATLRRTLAQSAGAIMWSVRMIGVAIAFLAPWAIAIVAVIWIIASRRACQAVGGNQRLAMETARPRAVSWRREGAPAPASSSPIIVAHAAKRVITLVSSTKRPCE